MVIKESKNDENILLIEINQLFIHTDNNLCKLILHYMKQGVNSSCSYDKLKSFFIPLYSTLDRLNSTLNSMVKYDLLIKHKFKNVIIYELKK